MRIDILRFRLVIGAIFLSVGLYAQTTVSGIIRTGTREPLAGASISLEGSYDGTTSLADGTFSFVTTDKGKKKLIVSFMGYKDHEQIVNLDSAQIVVDLILHESVTELQLVTVTAGSFEASDKKRSTILKPLDIVTTAGAHADIVGALKTLPGVQQVNESNGLFVRGGTGVETRVFIDGMRINNPFYSAVPDIGQRARFSPLLV